MHFLLSPSDSCQRYCIYRFPVILTLWCTLPLPTLLPAQVFLLLLPQLEHLVSVFGSLCVCFPSQDLLLQPFSPPQKLYPGTRALFRNSVRSHCRNQGLNLVPRSFFQPQKSPSPLSRLCFQLVLGLLKRHSAERIVIGWVFSVFISLHTQGTSAVSKSSRLFTSVQLLYFDIDVKRRRYDRRTDELYLKFLLTK